MSLKSKMVFATFLAGVISLPVSAAGPDPEYAVGYRKGVFNVIAWNFGPMVAMAKKEMPFNRDLVLHNAKRMNLMIPMALEGFIPDSIVGDSEAKPEIWENWDDFKAKMDDFKEASAKLEQVAASSGDEAAVATQIVAVGKTCKSCHDDYKEE